MARRVVPPGFFVAMAVTINDTGPLDRQIIKALLKRMKRRTLAPSSASIN